MPRLLIFDSGIGGLGVVAEIRALQPYIEMIYLADNGFYPYGEKPDEVLLQRILAVIGQGIEIVKPNAVVVACNTASTVALGALRAAFSVPFIGCVPPVKPAAAASRSLHIGLLATPATLRRPYLQDLIESFAGGHIVHSLGTPVLADLAEAKFRGQPVDMTVLEKVVSPLFAVAPIDAVALGCTHYTFLRDELAALYPAIAWFDPAGAVARQTLKVAGVFADATECHASAKFFNTANFKDGDSMASRIADYGFRSIERLGAPAA